MAGDPTAIVAANGIIAVYVTASDGDVWGTSQSQRMGRPGPGAAHPPSAFVAQCVSELFDRWVLTLRRDTLDAILTHALESAPEMACGLVAGHLGSDRPERFVPMENAAHSPTFWNFDGAEQFRVWREMDARDEEPVVIYYSDSNPEAYPSDVTIRMAALEDVHYLIVSTARPGQETYRSFRIADGTVTEEEITVVDAVPGTGRSELRRLFDAAREKAVQPSGRAEADRLFAEVIRAYRDAVQDDPSGLFDRQQLARALWRHGQLLLVLSRPDEAATAGREAVTLFDQAEAEAASQNPDVTAPARDEALGELITAMADLGEIRFAAGDAGGRAELLDQALARGLRAAGTPAKAGPLTRQALGTAYHNHAVSLLHRAILPPEPDVDRVREAELAASRAAELRQNLLDEARPLSGRELANTYVVYIRCLAVVGDLDRADAVLGLALRLVGVLGAMGEEFVPQLEEVAGLVAAGRGHRADTRADRGEGRRRWWR